MDLPTLRDGDLLLRHKLPGDADALVAACQDPEIQRWTSVPSPYTRADADHFIAISEQEAEANRALHLIAVDAEAGRLLGSFSIMELDREPGYGEIGYWVAADARGGGIATRAVLLLTDWARAQLGLTRLEILPHKDNAPSQRVAEKAGYRDTGRLVAGPRGENDDPVFMVYALDS